MAVAKVLVHVNYTPLMLWLRVFLFHCGWQCQLVYSRYQGLPEVVTPLRITGTYESMRPPGWISYSLHFGGKTHIFHMKVNKHLLARNMPVFTYTDQGALLEDEPFVQHGCFYNGYVEGDPESLVALSSCFGGFRGMFQIHDITYEIKPQNRPNTFEHLIYRMDTEDISPSMRCGLTDEEIEQQLKSLKRVNSTLMQSGYEGWWSEKRYLELAVVVDHNRYLHSESNASNVYIDICIVMNGIDFFLKSLDIEIILIGIEIWTDENHLHANNMIMLLSEFCKWKKSSFTFRLPHHVAHLFIKQVLSGTSALAYVAGVCHSYSNCGVENFVNDKLQEFAFTVSHELGHSLGMGHDNDTCTCGKGHCIMNPSKALATRFSNCSYIRFWNHLIAELKCLHSPSQPDKIPKYPRCGNSLIEDEEECDCGSLKLCEENPCCQSNCTLTPDAVCASGLCCKGCQFLPSGTECRKQENECDLPEWCDGISYHCPEDMYVQDGTPCTGGSYCYEKKCNNRDEQCRKIFGNGSRSADLRCYMEINIQGDRFGHCGFRDYRYIQCSISDTLCGRLQCENVTKIPHLKDHSTVHWTQFNDITCWGTDYHVGMTIPDIGDVEDGTECGVEHICIERKCIHVSSFDSICSPVYCNMSGVCNNRQHCHCNTGWDPPNCQLPGNGGSIDSGPHPPILRRAVDKKHGYVNAVLIILIIHVIFFFLCMAILTYVRLHR
ncbi:disintegrin and metalloproteinase domain-containing protein 29-like [Erinaceus europaeus]|uniref:Disintegrin and metalloproteinase domain-containing protein 29-like n=1 Tax=Erinaceus europaeus TaxID=9365 RepID=A0ABM3X0R3_ERIEU|nr:disintegrin and metalloproteinase domain-containing protein 29-like [Erinaceus europaeus]XP_060042413.1 disintegrin and metalloproteinase domain-containing protein 29-like [Erinaceus europaeus]